MVTCDVELSRKAGILVDEFIWRVLSLCSRICPIAGGVVKACKSVQFASSACLIRALGCPPRYIYYGYSTALQLPVRGAAVEFGSTNDGLGSREEVRAGDQNMSHRCHHHHCSPPPPRNHPCIRAATNRSRFLIFIRTHLGEERPD